MSYYSPYTFKKGVDFLFLTYELTDNDWVQEKIKSDGRITLKRIFVFSSEDFEVEEPTDPEDVFSNEKIYSFRVGVPVGEYYKITKISTLQHDLYIHRDVDITINTFLSHKISIFHIIDKMVDHDIYIGGENEKAISIPDFNKLIIEFPNDYEITKYRTARISAIIKENIDLKKDYQLAFEKYLNKKVVSKPPQVINDLRDNEIAKYSLIKSKLNSMLKDESISEQQWQQEILEFILLLFPKYIKVIRELPIKDCFSGTIRHVDFSLIDSSGYIDIVEIKKPDAQSIVSQRTYRDNHIPIRDLSGAIMQVEKYVLNLNKWGQQGEDYLNKKYTEEIPANFNIKIINPSGLIIMGRTVGLTQSQLVDFEVVKRKYKNVIDIITYDDLLLRLDRIISQFDTENFFTE